MQKKIVAVDFDGVVHAYNGWKGPLVLNEESVPGAIPFLLEAMNYYHVAIFSSRSRYWGARRRMKKWLRERLREHFSDHGFYMVWLMSTRLPMDPFIYRKQDAIEAIIKELSFPLRKPSAHLTIDDRAWCFSGQWPSMEEMLSFEPWWKTPNQSRGWR